MSLINEALKKAQKMRSEPQAGANPYAPPPATPPPPVAPPPSKREDSAAPSGGFSGKSVAYIAGLAGLVACISILFTVLILRRPASPEPSPAEHSQAAREPVSEAASTARPAVQAPEQARGATSAPLPVVPVPTSPGQVATGRTQGEPAQTRAQAEIAAPARANTQPTMVQPQAGSLPEGPRITLPVASAPRAEPSAAPTRSQATAAAAAEQSSSGSASASPFAPAPLPPERPLIQLPASIGGPAAPQAQQELSLEQACQQFVNKTRISGIRPGIKVLVNSRAYKPGDVVEAILGLRLVEIGQDHLVFTDAAGRRYTRNF